MPFFAKIQNKVYQVLARQTPPRLFLYKLKREEKLTTCNNKYHEVAVNELKVDLRIQISDYTVLSTQDKERTHGMK